MVLRHFDVCTYHMLATNVNSPKTTIQMLQRFPLDVKKADRQTGQRAAYQRAKHRNWRIRPVRAALPGDGKNRMRDPGAQITRRIHAAACRPRQ